MYKRQFSSFIELLIFIYGLILPIMLAIDSISPVSFLDLSFNIIAIITWSIFFLKDIFNGSSPIKKLFGLRVIDIKSNLAASPMKTVLRNSTLILLFPIEMFTTFFSPQKRIGDLIAGTKLIEVEKISIRQLKNHFHVDSKINIWIVIIVAMGLVIIESVIYITVLFNLMMLS